jgi:hypothetical protein
VAAFTIPTARSFSLPLNRDSLGPPSEPPKVAGLDAAAPTQSQLTTESTQSSAVTSSITTDEYFELRRINEDGTLDGKPESLIGDYNGELLLSDKSKFEEFIRERGDGNYEIWFITKDTREGALIERPVIQFRLESGHLAPPTDDSLKDFKPQKPFRLIPVTPPPEIDASDNSDSMDGNADDNRDGPNESNDLRDSSAFLERPDPFLPKVKSFREQTSVNTADTSEEFPNFLNPEKIERGISFENDSFATDASSLGAGVLIFAGTRRWQRRASQPTTNQFSQASRLSRKRNPLIQ